MTHRDPSDSDADFLSGMAEHLSELRSRIIVSFVALTLTTLASFFLSNSIINFLARPIGGLQELQSIEITENMTAVFRVALLSGIVLASPVIFYEFLAFILPGLKENEKRLIHFFLPAMILFFLLGIAFAFFIILPVAIPFLIEFMGIRTAIRTSSYISFIVNLLLWVGVTFEMPVVVFILAKTRIVSAEMLLKGWRQAVVVCAILAMVITPTTDPVNMMLLMVPLVTLYFISVFFAKIARR